MSTDAPDDDCGAAGVPLAPAVGFPPASNVPEDDPVALGVTLAAAAGTVVAGFPPACNAPDDDQAVVGVPLAGVARVSPAQRSLQGGTPLVLQVSLLKADSNQKYEFFYNPFANIDSIYFIVECAFFICHDHIVVFHKCPDPVAFKDLFPLATIGYLLALPSGLIDEGHDIVQSQYEVLYASQ